MADSTAVTMWPWPDWKTLDKWEVPAVAAKYGPLLKYDPVKAASELDRLGFTKYVKAGDGYYEKRAGKGPDVISKDAPLSKDTFKHLD